MKSTFALAASDRSGRQGEGASSRASSRRLRRPAACIAAARAARGRGGFGRGRAASLGALRGLTSNSRGAVVKARVVRHGPKAAPLATHLSYLRRDGVTRDGAPGKMFDAAGDAADARAFAERCQGDRHHFRFIVSPDDAAELSDLRAFTRDLMAQDGARSRDQDRLGRQSIIGTPSIRTSMCWRADAPTMAAISSSAATISAEVYAPAPRSSSPWNLVRAASRKSAAASSGRSTPIAGRRSTRRSRATPSRHDGVIDLRPGGDEAGGFERTLLVGRARKLERLGLAAPLGPGQWMMAEEAESVLRKLGERGDIIKRIHRGLVERGAERAAADFVLDAETRGDPIVGRLLSRGLDDELKGSAFAVIDGIDGRTHHVRLKDLDAASDAALGDVVEARRLPSRDGGAPRLVLAVRSDLSIEDQIHAEGATWLDRRLVAKEPMPLSDAGFGREVQSAMEVARRASRR